MMRPDPPCRCGCPPPRPELPRPCPPPTPCQEWRPCPPSPCQPAPSAGFLLPRVLAAGRQWQRPCQLCLELHCVPESAEYPLTLLSVHGCGDCTYRILPTESSHALCLQVNIPLHCQLRDRCGHIYAASASLTTEVTLRPGGSMAECWRHQVMLLPCVRLLCAACPSECPRFDVQLELLLEAYLVRWEPCTGGMAQPVCPQLPLYPQPCFN